MHQGENKPLWLQEEIIIYLVGILDVAFDTLFRSRVTLENSFEMNIRTGSG